MLAATAYQIHIDPPDGLSVCALISVVSRGGTEPKADGCEFAGDEASGWVVVGLGTAIGEEVAAVDPGEAAWVGFDSGCDVGVLVGVGLGAAALPSVKWL